MKAYLIDPPGSGLYHLITNGVMFDRYVCVASGLECRHYSCACHLLTHNSKDTLTVEPLVARSFYEGIGINRQTENFAKVSIDAFIRAKIAGICGMPCARSISVSTIAPTHPLMRVFINVSCVGKT